LKPQLISTEFTDTLGQRENDNRSPSYLETIKKSGMILRENEKLLNEEASLSAERPRSTDLDSIEGLIERLKKGVKERAQFVDSNVNKGIAFNFELSVIART
jgi:hypothetical protein